MWSACDTHQSKCEVGWFPEDLILPDGQINCPRTTVATKLWSPRRARRKRSKTIRAGKAGYLRLNLWFCRVLFCCTRTMGASRCPAFPAPSRFERHAAAKLGRDRRREGTQPCRSSSLTFE